MVATGAATRFQCRPLKCRVSAADDVAPTAQMSEEETMDRLNFLRITDKDSYKVRRLRRNPRAISYVGSKNGPAVAGTAQILRTRRNWQECTRPWKTPPCVHVAGNRVANLDRDVTGQSGSGARLLNRSRGITEEYRRKFCRLACVLAGVSPLGEGLPAVAALQHQTSYRSSFLQVLNRLADPRA
jgi:hypothetical protein